MSKPFVIYIIIVFIIIFIYIWQQNTSIRLAYRISKLNNIYERIDADNDSLKLNINSILSLEKMNNVAKNKKLHHPNVNSIIYVRN
ncbi:MAG: hypothetical protein LBL53_02320 [Endomicrobium sp.]|jgi:cell division protein FtsL|nr:hypothetical protein [Endomicrobium sp.]